MAVSPLRIAEERCWVWRWQRPISSLRRPSKSLRNRVRGAVCWLMRFFEHWPAVSRKADDVKSSNGALALCICTLLAGCAPLAVPTSLEQLAVRVQSDIKQYPALADDPNTKGVLRAFAKVDRRDFVPVAAHPYAYVDLPLNIDAGQTISSPSVVAIMTAAVGARAGSNVLEVGTGSGYQAAILSELGAHVHSMEILADLALSARTRLLRLGFANVDVRLGDGFWGWPQQAPYDAIIVTAGARDVPAPLLEQLKIGGKLVMPIGANGVVEQLVLVSKKSDGYLNRCSLGPAMFVPLTGVGQKAEKNAVYDRSIPLCFKGQTARWPGQSAR